MNFFCGDSFGRLKGKLSIRLSALGQLKGKITFNCPTKHLKIAEQVSLGVLQHPNQFQENTFGGNKFMEDLGNLVISSLFLIHNVRITNVKNSIKRSEDSDFRLVLFAATKNELYFIVSFQAEKT